MQILAISGSLRRHSNNTRLLRALREEAPEDVEITIWDGLKQLPHYDADDDVVPGPITVEAFRQLVRGLGADRVLAGEGDVLDAAVVDAAALAPGRRAPLRRAPTPAAEARCQARVPRPSRSEPGTPPSSARGSPGFESSREETCARKRY